MSTSRREFMAGAAAMTASACGAARGHSRATAPSLFVSHGSPGLALDVVKGADFARLGASLGTPRAVLVVSAHWEVSPPTIGATTTKPVIHDYGGFAAALRTVEYAAPGAAAIADRVAALVPGASRADDRGWDHGVWVPLVHMFPDADVPVLQLSLPSRLAPEAIVGVGRRLRGLRDEGVVILASGGMTHNLRSLDLRDTAPPPNWAVEFEDFVRSAVEARDVDALVDYRLRAPAAERAHPTEEHFLPLLVALGAADVDRDAHEFPIEGFEYGSLSRLAVRWG